MQFQADVLGVPVRRPDVIETTALGAAGLAGIALGLWRDAGEFVASRQFTTFIPAMEAGKRERLMTGWRRAVAAALASVEQSEA
jgi:glycerol kinase